LAPKDETAIEEASIASGEETVKEMVEETVGASKIWSRER